MKKSKLKEIIKEEINDVIQHKITLEEEMYGDIIKIKEFYPHLKSYSHSIANTIYFDGILKEQLITEFIETVVRHKTIKHVKQLVGPGYTFPDNDSKQHDIESFILIKFDKLTSDSLDNMNKNMLNFGWFPASIDNKNGIQGKYSDKFIKCMNQPNVIIKYEANKDTTIIPVNRFLYHITPDYAWKRIKLNGLTPRTSSKLSNHPERIYLFDGKPENYDSIASYLIAHNVHKNDVRNSYMMEIDTNKIPNIKYFKDPNFPLTNAIWTYQNIPPIAIKIDPLGIIPNDQYDVKPGSSEPANQNPKFKNNLYTKL